MPAVRSCLQVTAVIEYMRESRLTDERQTPAFAVSFLDANKELVCDIVGIESVDAMTHPYSESILEERNKRGLGVGASSRCIMAGFQEGDLKTHEHYASALLELIGNYPLLAEYTNQYHMFFPADFPGQQQVRRAVDMLARYKKNMGQNSTHPTVPDAMVGLIPILGPLHLPLNLRTTLFKVHYAFFTMLYLGATGQKLPESPSTYRIDLVIVCLASCMAKKA